VTPGRRGRTPGRADQARRALLLDAAERVFHRRGYAGATIQEIADEFGILKGSTYHYVRSKEELLLEVAERAHQRTFAALETAVGGSTDPVATVWLFIKTIVELNAEMPAMGGLAKAALELPPGASRDRILAQRARFETLFTSLLAQAREAGGIRDDLDTKVVAYGILGLANSIYLWYRPGGRLTPRRLGRTYADMIMSGLTPGSEVASTDWAAAMAGARSAMVPSPAAP
jgi:TetR/AcrR family transcriptional regulator, cholesterol catabolism regulator